MPKAESPPIANGPGSYTWTGTASVISYQVRFYRGAKAVGELAQAGGDATRAITVSESWHYSAEDITTPVHSSTIENTPSDTVTAGEWRILGLGLGEQAVTFTVTAVTPPAGATHYRILVKS